jgi:predicted GIY-YIG superfamily endonuclease
MSEYFVYILINHKNYLYTGITNNLLSRLSKHNLGYGSKYTRKYNTWKYYKIYGIFTKSLASSFEWYCKHELINNKWKRLRSGLEHKNKHINKLLHEDKWSNIINLKVFS